MEKSKKMYTYSHLYPNKQGELADKLEIENNREEEE